MAIPTFEGDVAGGSDYRFGAEVSVGRFFTVGTLVAFFGGFGAFDAFLHFLFEDFGEDFSSFGEEKRVEVVERLTVGGLVQDEITVVE